jgi:hypothetical protein
MLSKSTVTTTWQVVDGRDDLQTTGITQAEKNFTYKLSIA